MSIAVLRLAIENVHRYGRDYRLLIENNGCYGPKKRLNIKTDDCLYAFFFWLIRSLADPTLAACIVCCPLQLVTHQSYLSFWVDDENENPGKPYRGLPQDVMNVISQTVQTSGSASMEFLQNLRPRLIDLSRRQEH